MVKKKDASVELVSEPTVPYMSVIISEHGIPQFKFSGMWNVREILKVERVLGRKYREYMKQLRDSKL